MEVRVVSESQPQCTRCYSHVATTTDKHGDGKPLCAHCMDGLDRMRWAAGEGMPMPAVGALWPAPEPCTPMNPFLPR
ncbi:hypothetical protein QC999_gp13 [Microbacterium phage Cressida]|uniref:Uncharacterized protein n=1 Tax=Microbacterium phage Cressida TaxID=2591216 RepID=A0A514DIA8_9CAUD|nr:hypothetical protein QC999_gp13 [Microbacterium phage Cressida]QDH93337.1 hypothetical protein PBI_CRESSIDA_95 [Microbacterium phage Cressida]